jgi:hypothetical protein
MELSEAKSATKAIYLQAAALAGLEVSYNSPEELVKTVVPAFNKIEAKRRPEAVANLLRLVAGTLDLAQKKRTKILREEDVRDARDEICPVYPFTPQLLRSVQKK